ncbi:MAG: hypothetical protein KDA87_20065 [Planctomycetales bacterium]|nr:hypothetical protein [Planctomycetales bacterium]
MNERILPTELLELMDRLVDGELSDAERNSLLRQCEETPDWWRSLALSYVEAQAWSNDLQDAMWGLQEMEGSNALVATSDSLVSQPMKPLSTTSRMAAGDAGWPWTRMMNYMGMAAAVLVSLSLGFGFGSFVNSFGQNPSVPNSIHSNVAKSGVPGADTLVGADRPGTGSLPLLVPMDNQQGYRSVEIPLVEIERWLQASPNEEADSIPRLLRGLERHGRVVRESQYLPVQMDDGRRIVVPIGNVRVDFDAYQ